MREKDYNTRMKKTTPLLLLALACGLGGCFSLETGKLSDGSQQIVSRNYGWYLFDIVPLFCGNAAEDASCGTMFFRNDVQMDKIQSRVLKAAAKKGKTVDELAWTTYDTVMFTVPIFYISFPVPYIITYREKQLSGVMK